MKVFCTYCGAANAAGTPACIACGTALPPPDGAAAPSPTVPDALPAAPDTGPAWPPEQPAPPFATSHAPLWDPPRPFNPETPDPYAYPVTPYAPPESPFPPVPPAAPGGYPPMQAAPPYPAAAAPAPYQGPGGWAPYPAPAQPPPYPPATQAPPYPLPVQPPYPRATYPPYQQPYPQTAYGQPPFPATTPAPYGAPPGYTAGTPYSVPPGAMQPMGPGNYAMAGLHGGPGSLAATLPRFGAFLFDLVVYGVTAIVLLTLAGALGLSGLGVLLALALHPLYYIGFWSTSGQTPGYRAASLQLIKTDGTQPGVGAATVRYIGWHVSQWALYLGCLWMIWDYQKQTWHDKMARTLVIRA